MEGKVRTLITFLGDHHVLDAIEAIRTNYDLQTDIFLYEREGRVPSLFLTFKAFIPDGSGESSMNETGFITKFINRHPQTNTLFSINALNRICLKEIGRIDPTHPVNWEKYRNQILMLRNIEGGNSILVENPIKLINRFSKDGGASVFKKKEVANA